MVPKHSRTPLADRLKRLEARASCGCVDTNAARRAMIDRDKDSDLTSCAQKSCRHIGAPHLINGIRDDCTVMRTRTLGRSLA